MKNENTTHWPVHPIALLFPPKPPEERGDMKGDMKKRVANGLDPLENPILKYENMILDGRTRDEIWVELAKEGACGGYFKNVLPRTENFSPEKDGTIGAWMRAKSRNLIVRQTPADQRAAIFLKATEQFPELENVIGKIKQKNLEKQKEGKPLAAGDPRGNTNKEIGKLAGVGSTVVKQVQKLRKESPARFEEVAKGKISAKQALKEIKQEKQEVAPSEKENLVKGDRPKIADLVGIIHRGLAAGEEAEGLDLKTNAVFFRVSGYRVKVMCKIV